MLETGLLVWGIYLLISEAAVLSFCYSRFPEIKNVGCLGIVLYLIFFSSMAPIIFALSIVGYVVKFLINALEPLSE